MLRSSNKIKTTWETVKVESGKKINKSNNEDIQEINVDCKSTDNPHIIVNIFDEYFFQLLKKFTKTTRILVVIIMLILVKLGVKIVTILIVNQNTT
jgi:hypothetical protein